GPLLTLDFDRIKLDQGFVRALDRPRGVALVKAVVAMADALGCEMIAEGVETQQQLDALGAMGCTYAQGWLIGRPQSLNDVIDAARAIQPQQ
ncbi:MAG: EAL domain-containing protein, partial [Dokdonella sp.]